MRAAAVMCQPVIALILFLALGYTQESAAQDFQGIDGPLGPRSSAISPRDFQDPANSQLRALDCSGAIPVMLGSEVSGSTVGLPAQQDEYGCGDEPETGPELVYSLELTEPAWLEITIESSADLDVILLNECNPDLGCLALGDVGVRSVRPVSGSYYIVVDGYAGAEDEFTLRVTELSEVEIPEHFCPPLFLKREYRETEWNSTTCGLTSDIDALLCSYSLTAGRESEPSIFGVEAGGTIRVTVTPTDADLAIYLINSCGVSSQCLAFADQGFAGEVEALEWVNPDLFARPVYLVVDTVGASDACGDFHILVQFDGIVPNGGSSWSALKSWFGSQGGEQ